MKRNMMIVTFIAAALLSGTVINAQEAKPLRFGVEAGGVMSNFTDAGLQSGFGFYAGVRGLYGFEKNAYATASLRYIQKGSDGIDGDADGDVTYTPGYIELPVAVGMQGLVGKRTVLFGETGPYFAYGVCGKNKGYSFSSGPDNSISWDRDFFSKANGSPHRFDWGWHARAGVRFSHIELSLSYEHGFVNVWKDQDSKTTAWTLGVGYLL